MPSTLSHSPSDNSPGCGPETDISNIIVVLEKTKKSPTRKQKHELKPSLALKIKTHYYL